MDIKLPPLLVSSLDGNIALPCQFQLGFITRGIGVLLNPGNYSYYFTAGFKRLCEAIFIARGNHSSPADVHYINTLLALSMSRMNR